ncbi:MAG: phosphotransferase [Tumebacillaceae bacterium]
MAIWQPTSSEPLFQTGQAITGLWHHHRYTIDGQLGHGANGEVYRVTDERGRSFALKVSLQAADIALEHKILKQLQGVARGVDLGPLVYDLDDVVTRRGKAFFYVMEWVRGTSLAAFLQKRGRHWLPVLFLQLSTCLERLHASGHCFGDLKADNCIVDEERGILRLVDFGGVTPFGRGVKEYTEWYDRAWWGQGSRMADEGYDLFAMTMLKIALLAPDLRAKAQTAGCPNFSLLKQAVLADARFSPYRDLLAAVWDGRIRKVDGFRYSLPPLVKASVEAEKHYKEQHRERDWSDWLLIGSAVVLLLVFCQFLLF